MKASKAVIGHECGNVGTLGAHSVEFETTDPAVIATLARVLSADKRGQHYWLISDAPRAAVESVIGAPVRRGAYVWFV